MMSSTTVDPSTQVSSVSETVVSAVAQETGLDPLSLEPLHDAVDPDALDALFDTGPGRTNGTPRSVEFRYGGCDVVVFADGAVEATRRGEESTDTAPASTDDD